MLESRPNLFSVMIYIKPQSQLVVHVRWPYVCYRFCQSWLPWPIVRQEIVLKEIQTFDVLVVGVTYGFNWRQVASRNVRCSLEPYLYLRHMVVVQHPYIHLGNGNSWITCRSIVPTSFCLMTVLPTIVSFPLSKDFFLFFKTVSEIKIHNRFVVSRWILNRQMNS